AFDESGSLAVEINTEALPLETMTGFIATHGLADSGRSLGDYLTPATRETLARSGLNQPEYARYKPWLAALAIQVAALERHGFSAQYGLDKHFLELAAARKLPIVELETFDEQMNLLAGLSEAEAEVFLQATLKEAADLPTLVAGFWSAWLRGDAPGFAELFFKDYNQYPELSGLMEKIITRRNHTMLERLGPLLAAPGRPRFVVIGAGHLVGPEGLLTLLAARNFQVDQLRKP
ncbi:MAG: TraB/GumN family protein, partial [Candidatus Adiutrix sp.]|nr:TraB/GumN family protein [Candidatus Adiutrix sp.]